MNHLQKHLSSYLAGIAVLLCGASPAMAQVTLGAASGFALLGGTNVTCTDGAVVTGDVGVSPGSAVPFTSTGCTIAGATPPATNAAAAAARTAFLSAYAALQLRSSSCIAMPGNLATQNLAPGIYCLDAVAKAGTLTLTGPANGVWIFLVNGALTGTNFSVVMAGGGQPCNVFWAPTGAATMTDSAFKGNILAGAPATAIDPGSITLTRGSLAGRAMANVAVTMTGASIIGCDALSGGASSCKGRDRDGDGDKEHKKCNQGVGNGHEDCDPGKSNHGNPFGSNDEHGGKPGDPGRKGGDR
jgi:hypothetical protein